MEPGGFDHRPRFFAGRPERSAVDCGLDQLILSVAREDGLRCRFVYCPRKPTRAGLAFVLVTRVSGACADENPARIMAGAGLMFDTDSAHDGLNSAWPPGRARRLD